MVNWFRNQNLAFRLILLTFAASLIVTFSNAVLFDWYYFNQNQQKQIDQLNTKIESLSPSIIEAHSQSDQATLEAKLKLLFDLNTAYSMRVVSNDGTTVFLSEVNTELNNGHFETNTYVIGSDVNQLTIQFLIEKHHFNLKFESVTFAKLLSGLIQTTLLCACIFFLSRLLIFRHLQKISDFTEHLTVKNFSQKLELDRAYTSKRHDELDNVVEAIETMRTGLIEDFDNRKAMELALLKEKEENQEAKRLIEDAKAADKAKSQFIATMSHEIRTPMNGIIGMVQMLQGTKIDNEQKNYLDIVSRSSNALMHIINDILDFSKLESGNIFLEKSLFALRRHLLESMQLFIGVANARNIQLIGYIHPDIPETIEADSKRLGQVISNLLGNAFKFTEKGIVTLDVQLLEKCETSCSLKFSIRDTGIGIAEKDQYSIFHAYRQADASMTRKYGGTGLGLTICKRIVETMGGEMGLKSEENKGSTFWFSCTFPCNVTASKDTSPAPVQAQTNGKIVFVEPNPYLSRYLIQHATSKNINIECISSVDEAVDYLNDVGATNGDQVLGCIVNSIDDEPELRRLHDALKQVDIKNFRILASGKPYKTLSKSELAKPFLQLRPLYIDSFFKLLVAKESNAPTQKATKNKQLQDNGALKALVAEDNAVNRIVIEGLLKKLDISTEFANNGEEAVSAICQKAPDYDLIFMDCEMPIMDGFDATVAIREWEKQQSRLAIPIIALTAHVESSYRERCFDSGMNLYLSKPVTAEKIDEAIKEVMPA